MWRGPPPSPPAMCVPGGLSVIHQMAFSPVVLKYFHFSSLSVSLIRLSLFPLAYFLVDEWLIVNDKVISKRKVCKENKQNAASAVTGELLEMSGHDRLPLKQQHCLWSEQHASGGRHFTWRGCRRGGLSSTAPGGERAAGEQCRWGQRARGWAPALQG